MAQMSEQASSLSYHSSMTIKTSTWCLNVWADVAIFLICTYIMRTNVV